MVFNHAPVMLEQCIDGLNILPKGVYVDATLGGGGHASNICARLQDGGTFIGIDKDMEAVEAASRVLARYMDKAVIVRADFSKIADIMRSLGISEADGFLLDLGVSSYQLEESSRGFSYMRDGPLDMRMDATGGVTAYDVVNGYDASRLRSVIYKYGEERWAKRIAEFIVDRRGKKPVSTTGELVDIIKAAIPAGARADGPHPAKRTFQAIRIEVNGELDKLGDAVTSMANMLSVGGRICVISFHSLEDRIVKNTFKRLAYPRQRIDGTPFSDDERQIVKIITKKPLVPSREEIETNPRARSAKLRIAERV
ncbi:MAG: 16S rRNA (cytosine(1402)-N(4))-methyltransferase RsmH [Clostridiales bacterium]|jgi:16S rRNA (cytosine1402-N4)-methyltransferase|nr:16S rRNA (cytosine(1402)-N(4))-methyltransferase RsmH [Clostridiales bacterium]